MKHDIRVSTKQDEELPWYDHSTLAAVQQCPRYAAITYRNNKRLFHPKINNAQNAGTAAHKFFAAWNIFHNAVSHSFTADELEQYYAAASMAEDEGAQTAFALEALYGLSDQLPEGRKGPGQIENSCIFWSKMQKSTNKVVATEQVFSITIDDSFRYVGLIDCLQLTQNGTIIPVEYKTASRIDTGYEAKWFLSNQITGYHIAVDCYKTGDLLPVDGNLADFVDVEVVTLPIVRSSQTPPYMRRSYEREPFHIDNFIVWAKSKIDILNKSRNKDTPWDAEMHETCYNFNSVCPLLFNFCNYDEETRKEIFETQMHEHVWNPLGD